MDVNRRDFLGMACSASLCATCGVATASAVNYLIAPDSPPPAGPVRLGSDDIPEGGFKKVRVGFLRLLIVRSEGRLTCVGARCTHAGGLVEWDRRTKQIRCPIHGARFDAEGGRPEAPASRPLTSYPVRSEKGTLIIEL